MLMYTIRQTCTPGVDGEVAQIQVVLGLEEGPDAHLLDPGDVGQSTEGHDAQELALVGSALSKLQECRVVDWLCGR